MKTAPSNRKSIDSLVPGVASGLAGLLTFLVLHHLWIVPIWFILPIGVVVAALGGVAVHRSYDALRASLPARPWAAPAMFGVVTVILLPSFVLAEMGTPLVDVAEGEIGASPLAVGVAFVLKLFVPTSIAGAVVGWVLGRTSRAAQTTALAGFVFALGPGHNIPFFGGTALLGTELGLMTWSTIAAAIVLVEVDGRLAFTRPIGSTDRSTIREPSLSKRRWRTRRGRCRRSRGLDAREAGAESRRSLS